jgi:hypothetical protein
MSNELWFGPQVQRPFARRLMWDVQRKALAFSSTVDSIGLVCAYEYAEVNLAEPLRKPHCAAPPRQPCRGSSVEI